MKKYEETIKILKDRSYIKEVEVEKNKIVITPNPEMEYNRAYNVLDEFEIMALNLEEEYPEPLYKIGSRYFKIHTSIRYHYEVQEIVLKEIESAKDKYRVIV